MRETEFEAPKETVDYLQRLAFEQTARQGVIDHIITAHRADPDASVLESPAFKAYMKDLADVTAEYELAKQALQDEIIPADMREAGCDWSLDFETRKVTVRHA